MTQEDKNLLLKDLSARQPFRIKFKTPDGNIEILDTIIISNGWINASYDIDKIKPYLHPLSSMTEDEFEDLKEFSGLKYEQLDLASYQEGTYKCLDFYLNEIPSYVVVLVFDWLNKHHFDYRGLLEKGLALEAPKGMYNIKEK